MFRLKISFSSIHWATVHELLKLKVILYDNHQTTFKNIIIHYFKFQSWNKVVLVGGIRFNWILIRNWSRNCAGPLSDSITTGTAKSTTSKTFPNFRLNWRHWQGEKFLPLRLFFFREQVYKLWSIQFLVNFIILPSLCGCCNIYN